MFLMHKNVTSLIRITAIRQRHMSVVASILQYTGFGDPVKVITKCEEKLAAPINSQILVKILAAPINPADINTIQGKSNSLITSGQN